MKGINCSIFKTDIELENDRVKLIPFKNPRNQELRKIIFNDEIWRFMGMYVKTNRDFELYISNTLKDQEERICYPFLIIDKLNNAVAGSTRYGYLNFISQKCEIGWTWLGKEFQGTDLNRNCKYLLLEFGFKKIGFRRIQFCSDQENIRSQKAIERLGAYKEGFFRNNYVDSEGKSRNDVYYSIIDGEWKDIKAKFFTDIK